MNDKNYYVYIMSSKNNSTLYVGVTNNLLRRVYEHKNNMLDGFSKRYKTHKLVYFEQTNDVISSINREKQIKKFTRTKQENLINQKNSQRIDLSDQLL